MVLRMGFVSRSALAQPSMRKRWLREPLLHFLLAGLALFLVHQAHTERRTMRTRRRYSKAVLLGAALSGLMMAPALAQQKNPERDAYFGETHVHTSWSLDAWLIGNRITDPGDAYKYFKGEPIKHPMGFEVKIDTPLDWAGVTDHSAYVGVMRLANDPGSPVSKLAVAQPLILKARTKEEMERV